MTNPPAEFMATGSHASPSQASTEVMAGIEADASGLADGVLAALNDFEVILSGYEKFLRGQRGLSDNTVRIYLTDLASFRQYMAVDGLSLNDMNRQTLRGYLAWLATSARDGTNGYARVSIVRKLTALRSFYRYLAQDGHFRSSPVPSGRSFQVKVGKPLPTFLGKREVVRLLESPDCSTTLGLRDRAILEVLYACGIRLAEIQGMDIQDVNFGRQEILVRGKGSKERLVLFGKSAGEFLRRYLQEARPQLAVPNTGALFLNRYGDRLSRRSIEKLVRRYAALAGLKDGVHTHTLRHTFASHMLEGDADLRVIQELLGHSSPTTTQIYTHVTKLEARNAYLSFHPRAGGDGVEWETGLTPVSEKDRDKDGNKGDHDPNPGT